MPEYGDSNYSNDATRAMRGDVPFTGVPDITTIPDKVLKLCTPNKDEVETEALAYALTQLSIFADRIHANELHRDFFRSMTKVCP